MVIKRFSNMLGSRHGANPFTRTRSTEGGSSSEAPATTNYVEGSPEDTAAKGVVCH